MLSDTSCTYLLTQHALRGEQTWWLAVVHPEQNNFDRACLGCGSFDNLVQAVDIQDIFDSLPKAPDTVGEGCLIDESSDARDAILTCFCNMLRNADVLHDKDLPATVAVCKTCQQWMCRRQKNAHGCLLPLQALMYLLRTAEAVPDMRSMDVRIVHKLCLTLSEQVCLGSRHLVNPYKHCFYNTEQLLFEKIAVQPLQKVKSLIAEHFSAENNKSRYFSSKAVEFMRLHLSDDTPDKRQDDYDQATGRV